jgi:hypothetical protein
MGRREWSELLSDKQDALSRIRERVDGSPHHVEFLSCQVFEGRRVLEALQVTTRSHLGALALHTGGLLVDHGWLRVLGAGNERLPRALDTWNGLPSERRFDEGLLVADDVLGGFFAWFSEHETVHYLAPDTLHWEDLELGYGDWLHAMLGDSLAEFYESLRWPGWQNEVSTLGATHSFNVWPPLVVSGPPLARRTRRAVPVEESWSLHLDMARQLRDLPDGAEVRFKVCD